MLKWINAIQWIVLHANVNHAMLVISYQEILVKLVQIIDVLHILQVVLVVNAKLDFVKFTFKFLFSIHVLSLKIELSDG